MTNDRLKERAYLVTLSFHAVLLLLLGWKAGLETSIALAMVFLGSVLAAPVVDGHDCDMTIMTPFNSEFQTVEPGQTAYSTAVKSLLFRQRVITCKKTGVRPVIHVSYRFLTGPTMACCIAAAPKSRVTTIYINIHNCLF